MRSPFRETRSQLETFFRILSFLTLGLMLLLVSFLYNRFAEALRKWI